jgi:hypothetical protein
MLRADADAAMPVVLHDAACCDVVLRAMPRSARAVPRVRCCGHRCRGLRGLADAMYDAMLQSARSLHSTR